MHPRPARSTLFPYTTLFRSGEAGQPAEAGAAVHGEALHPPAELGAVAHVVLRGVPAGELRQHGRELGVDGRAVVALHEVLDDQLPVGPHVVADAAAQGEGAGAVVLYGGRVAEPFG